MRSVIGLTTLIFVAPAIRAEPKDIAALFPADTILYAEVNQPGVVGKDLTAYLKGTVFATHAPGFKTLRERQDGGFNTSPSGLLAALLAPEMLNEAAQFKGLAGGIVGFDKQGEPELLFVLLPGESKLPGFLLKSFVTARADIRKITTVEGVDLFQRTIIQYNDDPLLPGPAPGPPNQKLLPIGPLYVNHAGLIVVGTNREHVVALIRRFKDKEKAGSLMTSASFKSLVEERTKPGILLLANARRLLEQIDQNVRASKDSDPASWLAFRSLLPPSSVGTLVGRLEIKDDDIRLQARIQVEEKAASPLARLLDGAGLSTADLNSIATQSPLSLNIAMPAEQRANRLLNALDAVIKSTGTLGPSASEVIDELTEKKLLTREDLARLNRIAFALPSITSWPKNQTPLPALVVYADDPGVLEKLESTIPAVLELLGGVKADPITETINGIRIHSLEAKASPTGQPIHYARHGNALAVGLDRTSLADLMRPPASTGSWLKHLDQPGMVCVWNWVETRRGPISTRKTDASPRRGVAYGQLPQSASPYYPGMRPANALRLPVEAFDQFDGLPPLVMALSRRDGNLLIDIKQADPKRVRTKGISQLFEWFVGAVPSELNYGGYGAFDRPIHVQPLLPPPPLPPNP
jgi:hypothetical protein